MNSVGLAQLILFNILGFTSANQGDCPPWSFPDANNGTDCVCRSAERLEVKCSRGHAMLRVGVCMTYNSTTEITEIGLCPYIYQRSNLSRDNFFPLPKHISNLTSFMCGSLHRKGRLCGECEDGFGPALYSYTLECKKCLGHGAGWLLYITLTVIPTTVLYIIVLVFRVSAPSPPLNAFVLFCHITVYTFRSHASLYLLFVNGLKGPSSVLLKVMLTLCGFWDLDIFRPIFPHFCISPNMKNLHAFTLEYIEAFYPLVLILITYICIKLHDHNIRPVVLLWKPFHRCFVYFRRSWDSEASIINAFATFLLLSFSKILFVSFTLLYWIHVKLVYRNGTILSSPPVMYYDSTVQLYSVNHLPFAGVSMSLGLTFIVFPTLLLILYPTRIFRKCIACCRFRRWHALHTFMEAFQGQYKDGTNGTRDFRIVSALYLVFRIALLITSSGNRKNAFGWLGTAIVLFSTSLFFAIVRPYKVNYFNVIDSIILAMVGLLTLIGQFVLYIPNQMYSHALGVTGLLLMCTPHAALVLCILYTISKKIRILQRLKRKCLCRLSLVCCNEHSLPNSNHAGLNTDPLPDRLVHPDEYEPLIPAVKQQRT